ncbi:MAG: AAA family ATPase [Candidatus Paceibacteria bacterium]
MIIGIAGTDGSGKGTVVDHLVKNYGFAHYSSRAIILEHINAFGLPDTRAQMRLSANELRAKHGNDFLVTQALKRMQRDGVHNAIIESIRATAEANTLKSHGGILLAVDANQELRYERVQARRSETDRVSFEQFVAHEELEKNDPDPHGMQKGKVIEMADYTIMNDGTIEELHQAVDAFMQKYL